MSRTNPSTNSGSTNPASKFIEWDSAKAKWKYYDKDKKQEFTLPMDTPFIVLDQLSTVKGFSESGGSGYWANEVRKMSDKLTLRTKQGIVAVGKWSELKANPVCTGAKFSKSVYAMAKVVSEYELVNFQFSGCASMPWFDFVKLSGGDSGIYGDIVVACKEYTDERKGSNKYKAPKFSIIGKSLSPEAAEQADNMDKLLQAHLDAYFGQAKEEEEEPTATPATSHASVAEALEDTLGEDDPF